VVKYLLSGTESVPPDYASLHPGYETGDRIDQEKQKAGDKLKNLLGR